MSEDGLDQLSAKAGRTLNPGRLNSIWCVSLRLSLSVMQMILSMDPPGDSPSSMGTATTVVVVVDASAEEAAGSATATGAATVFMVVFVLMNAGSVMS